MTAVQLVKAKFLNVDTGEEIPCMFNPPSYSFSKDNSWAEATGKGMNTPALFEFNGGKSSDLTIDLFFDTHLTGEDVRKKYTNAIWKLALVEPSTVDAVTQKGRPPVCEFSWGTAWSFKAVVTGVTQKFTFFLEDGTPTRADVTVKLRQVEDAGKYPGQNPTSGGQAGQRVHVVQQRETLDMIAAREYGASRYWRLIAEANKIDDPLRLKPGQMLSLPPLGSQ
jgi:hypothetical protein